MIRTIAVCAGSDTCAQKAQDHAIGIATMFGARLRVVGGWEGKAGPEEPGFGESPLRIWSSKRWRNRSKRCSRPACRSRSGSGVKG